MGPGFSLNKNHQLKTKTEFFHITKFIEHKSESSVHINYKIIISHTGKIININWLTHLLSPDSYKMSAITYPFPSLLYKYFLKSYNFRISVSTRPICDCEFFPTFSIFCKHTSKFTCHPIFWVPDRKNRCRKSGVECRKSASDTCKQPKINEKKAKNRCRKSAVGCRKPHTCVRTLRHFKSDLHFKRKTKLQCCSNYKH